MSLPVTAPPLFYKLMLLLFSRGVIDWLYWSASILGCLWGRRQTGGQMGNKQKERERDHFPICSLCVRVIVCATRQRKLFYIRLHLCFLFCFLDAFKTINQHMPDQIKSQTLNSFRAQVLRVESGLMVRFLSSFRPHTVWSCLKWEETITVYWNKVKNLKIDALNVSKFSLKVCGSCGGCRDEKD